MGLEKVKNFFITYKVVIVLCIIMIIIAYLYVPQENAASVQNDNSGNKIQPIVDLGITDLSNKPYNIFTINQDVIFYLNDKGKVKSTKLDVNGTPLDKNIWSNCNEGIIFGIASNENTLYGLDTSRGLRFDGINKNNLALTCGGWNSFGTHSPINKITPVNGAVWIEKDKGEQYVWVWDRGTPAKSFWNSTKFTEYDNMKYDKKTEKIWWFDNNNNKLNYGKMGERDIIEKISIEQLKNASSSRIYDIYNDNLIVVNKSSGDETKDINVLRGNKYNIFKLGNKTNEYDEEYESLIPYAFINELLFDVCVTKNYVFILSKPNKDSQTFNIWVGNSSKQTEDTLNLGLKDAAFTRIATDQTDIVKLYAHPSCLYILYKTTIKYIKLEDNNYGKITKLENKNKELENKNKELNNVLNNSTTREKCKQNFVANFNWWFEEKKTPMDCVCKKPIQPLTIGDINKYETPANSASQ